MKKLMIAAAIVCAAAFANAATATWTFNMSNVGSTSPTAVKDGFNATEVGGTSENPVGAGYVAYYINGIDGKSYKTVGNSILSGLRAGKTVAQAIADGKLTLFATSQTDKDGYVVSVQGNVDTSMYYKDGGGEVKTDYLSVLEVILAENDADYVCFGWAGVAASKSSITGSVILSKYLRDDTGTASYNSNGWYAIPEPTSGLLLLLGVAGLALKRKRA